MFLRARPTSSDVALPTEPHEHHLLLYIYPDLWFIEPLLYQMSYTNINFIFHNFFNEDALHC